MSCLLGEKILNLLKILSLLYFSFEAYNHERYDIPDILNGWIMIMCVGPNDGNLR